MGFTIDMITGNISDITNGTDLGKPEETAPTGSSTRKIGNFEYFPQDRLLPVSDTSTHELTPDAHVIPDSLIDCDIDSFIEDITQ